MGLRSAWHASPTLEAAEFETVILKDGQRVTGEVVAEKANALYVDLGYDILRIPRDQILRASKGLTSRPPALKTSRSR